MRKAAAISTGLHVAVLLFAVLSFSSKTFEVTPAESLPVDLINDKDFSELTKGAKDAPKVEQPKPLIEKLDPPKPAEEIAPKLTEKKELKVEKEKTAEPKPDPIADKLKKQDEPKQEAKAEPQPMPPKKPPQKQQPKFDADKIAALLDKRDPQRNAATGAELNSTPSLGTATGNAAQLSASELDALRRRLMALWNPPVGLQDAERYQVIIRIKFKRDGTLAVGPQVITSGSGVRYEAMRDSAVRAVFVGQPYTMLRPEHYEIWKEIDFTFDTSQMFHDIPTR
ncbi:MAG: cell envelope integrity protein TolA [Rhizobiales bacterium]|nr:cell envelope integrity protein TolA [Hyphomicrobiales bacterium]